MDLISIIVPVYNVEPYLRQCINSIVNQTYHNLEIILVDDGSTDASGAICDEYGEQDGRITVYHQSNQGLSAARNKGMKAAKGDWIAFVDSDDWIDLNMYEKMLSYGCENNADLVLCKFKEVLQDEAVFEISDNESMHLFHGDELIEAYVNHTEHYSISPSVWDRLYRRELLGNMEFPVGRLNEDIFFTIEVFCKSEVAVYLDIPFYFYRINRQGGITASEYTHKRIEDNIILTERAVEYLNEQKKEHLAQLIFADFYLSLSDIYMLQKDSLLRKYIYGYLKRNRSRAWQLVVKRSLGKKERVLLILNCISPSVRKKVICIYHKLRQNL